MTGLELLQEAIRSVPVPGAPPRLSLDGAAIGLSFLDTVLRLNHVRRLTERISLVEHRVARRTIEVDIRLGMLDEGQVQASDLFRSISSHEPLPTGRRRRPTRAGQLQELWVPVARIPRTAAPVDVLDASGRKLPRLTQYEASRLLASGLYRLLRGILTSFPEAQRDTELGRLLYQRHEPRWLIQSALLTLFTDRSGPRSPRTPETTPGMRLGRGADHRALALRILGERYRPQLEDYFKLLEVAVNDFLLVVALDRGTDEHLLTYDAPLRADRSRRPWSAGSSLRTSGRGYLVRYEGSIPAGLRSYHLVVETEPGVDVEHVYFTTDGDRIQAEELSADLGVLSSRMAQEHTAPRGDAANKLLELQTQVTLRSLSELVRRRRWDAESAGFDFKDDRLIAASQLSWAAIAGEAKQMEGGELDNSLVRHQLVAPEVLADAAAEVRTEELGLDLATEDDPVGNRASLYWRRRAVRSPGGAETKTRAGILLRDAAPSGPATVLWYALSVASIAYVTAAFTAHAWWPYWGAAANGWPAIPNPGPLIAVLLLVPGFLYTRLPLPDRHSVAGQLRALPRLVAQVCIGSMALLCAAVAAGVGHPMIVIAFGAATAVPLGAGLLLVPAIARARASASGDARVVEHMRLIGAPRWVDGHGRGRDRLRSADVTYKSSGSIS